MNHKLEFGESIYSLAKELFPICRSITGEGVRNSLKIIQRHIPHLKIYEVPTGTKCFDWSVPDEWNISDAYILTPDGKKIANFKESNLSVVGYSEPIDKILTLDELQPHLHSLPEQPDAIPYITSYYKKTWGFCLKDQVRQQLKAGNYKVYINSELKPGSLTYGELLLPGKTKNEIFISTYICHPSMANNELSGPAVTTFLANFLTKFERNYSYRIIFIPETIGSIIYISKNLDELKKNVIAGFNVSCVGDNLTYSFLPSRHGNTISDRAATHVLSHLAPHFKRYSFLDRGSDERQYCAPGVDLPIASIMRSKYATYPEYHTSKDDLNFISAEGLQGGFTALQQSILAIEKNEKLKTTVLCEPQLGKHDLYPSLSKTNESFDVWGILNVLTYCDGIHDLLEIAEKIKKPIWEVVEIAQKLKDKGLVKHSNK